MNRYTVRKIKRFKGYEGLGYNAELLCAGVPVAFVIDEGNGGATRFQWYVCDRVPVTLPRRDGVETEVTIQSPKGEAALLECLKGQTRTFDGVTFDLDPDLFVGELVARHEEDIFMRRRCKNSTCFRLKEQKEGLYMTAAVVFTVEIGAQLRKQYGDKLEVIYNEKLEEVS